MYMKWTACWPSPTPSSQRIPLAQVSARLVNILSMVDSLSWHEFCHKFFHNQKALLTAGRKACFFGPAYCLMRSCLQGPYNFPPSKCFQQANWITVLPPPHFLSFSCTQFTWVFRMPFYAPKLKYWGICLGPGKPASVLFSAVSVVVLATSS